MIENHEVDPYLEDIEKNTDLDLEITKGEVDQVPLVGEIKRLDQEVIQETEQKRTGQDLKIGNPEKDHILAVVTLVVDLFLGIVDHIQETEDQEAGLGQKQKDRVVDPEIIIKIRKELRGSAQHLGKDIKIKVALEVERKDYAGLILILIVTLKADPQGYPEEILNLTLFHLKGKYILTKTI